MMRFRYYILLASFLVALVFAQEQAIFNNLHPSWNKRPLADVSSQVKGAILAAKHEGEKWTHVGKEYIKQSGLICTLVS